VKTRIGLAVVALGWLWAMPAAAQEFGLDLREEDGNEASEDRPAAAEGPVSAEEWRWQLQGEVPPATTTRVEEDAAVSDKVKAVQRKHFLKRRRFEITPAFAISLNDAFYTKVGGGVMATYHLGDSLGVMAHYSHFGIVETDNVRIAKRELRSLLLSSKLNWNAGLGLVWTPIYGKLSWFNSIVHYDLFLLTGLGVAHSQTSGAPVNDGLHPAVDVGVGQRFALTDWMAADFWVKGLLYADRPQDRQISEIQKVLTLNVGLSFWLPTSFTYGAR